MYSRYLSNISGGVTHYFIFQGLVFVNGANVVDASDSKSLYDIFEKGSENRHVASTSELLLVDVKLANTRFHHSLLIYS